LRAPLSGVVERAAERLFGWLAFAGVATLMTAMLVVIADIVARKAAGFSIKGTLDIQQLAQMACVFLVLPLAFLREANITVEFATDRLPPRALDLLRCTAQLTCALLLGAIAWYSFRQAAIQVGSGDRSQTLGIPLLLYWVPMLAGTLLSVAATLLLALKNAISAAVPR
jgi:TRAP-type C4-dicarboxylate transport system permease small subunit